jgi:hypothetical protein
MIVVEQPFEIVLENDPDRSEGLHVSTLIRELALKMKYLDAQWEDAELDVPTVSLGLAWEEYYSRMIVRRYRNMTFHPGELELDGIAMSPDGISEEDVVIPIYDAYGVQVNSAKVHVTRLHEFKSTKKSCPSSADEIRDDPKYWMWRCQMMAYCHALETQHATLHAFFINGNYPWMRKDNKIGTVNRLFDFIFTPQELQNNWRMLTNWARDREKYQ